MVLIGGNIAAHTTGCNESYTDEVSVLDLENQHWMNLPPAPRKLSSHTATVFPDGRIITFGSLHKDWVSDLNILNCELVPELKFWSYGEAKSVLKKEISGLRLRKSDAEIDSKFTKITSVLQQQFDRISAEEMALKNAREELDKRIKMFHKEKEIMKLYTDTIDHVVELDVGGVMFKTTTSTLQSVEGSMLASMFSGRYKIPKSGGAVFMDRDGTHFRYILNYLRNGRVNIPRDITLHQDLLVEAEYYQLNDFAEELKEAIFTFETP